RDPQRAELRLPLPAVAIGVVQRMERRLAGGTDELVLRPAASLSLFEELLVLLVSGDPALDSRHASPTSPRGAAASCGSAAGRHRPQGLCQHASACGAATCAR